MTLVTILTNLLHKRTISLGVLPQTLNPAPSRSSQMDDGRGNAMRLWGWLQVVLTTPAPVHWDTYV